MAKLGSFSSADAFRASLEHRLQREAKEKRVDLQRIRRQVAFDRLLARLFSEPEPPFFLKGGYALELRLASSRATKDMDLTYLEKVHSSREMAADVLLNQLQTLAATDLGDYFVYRIGSSQDTLDNAPYGGFRYPVVSQIANRLFVQFHLDVGGDFLVAKTETMQMRNWLDFCGLSVPAIRMISVEQQIAEKFHAYTLPREQRTNSRVKDLVDILLLIKLRDPQLDHLSKVLFKVFRLRNTHQVPLQLPSPPIDWARPYAALASECGIETDISIAFQYIAPIYLKIIHTNQG